MPLLNSYHLALEIYDQEGRTLNESKIENLVNCYQDFKFSAFLQGVIKDYAIDPEIIFEPIWIKEGKSPYCRGFRLNMKNKRLSYKKSYNRNVFRYNAYRIMGAMVQNQKFEAGTELFYRLIAFSNNKNTLDTVVDGEEIEVTTIQNSIPIRILGLEQLEESASVNVTKEDETDDFPVWIAEHVVEEMVEYVLQNKEKERAGFLIGHICRDPLTQQIFSMCHAQIAADTEGSFIYPDKGNSSITHFQFLPENFFQVQRLIELRKNNEIVLGWYHSHPWPFACEKREKCTCTSIFFSISDFDVMQSAFSAPYQIAIVIGRASLANLKATPQMYGWKNGVISKRNFYQFDASK
jgi:proteasome lid subunit RPN8/RPN11